MIFFGLGTIILNLFNYEFRILSWIYNWGEGVAWAIKIGLVILGAVLYFVGGSGESEELTEQNPDQEA